MKRGSGVHWTDESVHICDEKGEIVMWHKDEWVQDPSVVFVIVNAIDMFHSRGPTYMRRLMAGKTPS